MFKTQTEERRQRLRGPVDVPATATNLRILALLNIAGGVALLVMLWQTDPITGAIGLAGSIIGAAILDGFAVMIAQAAWQEATLIAIHKHLRAQDTPVDERSIAQIINDRRRNPPADRS